MSGRYCGSMYAQCAAGDVLHSSRHASWLSGNPSCPQRSSAPLLHAAASGTHWLHRFASVLQPGVPQSCVMVPSPVALQMRAPFASQVTNSFGVQVKAMVVSTGASTVASGVVSAAASDAGDGTSAGRGKSQAVRKTSTQICVVLAFTRRPCCARRLERCSTHAHCEETVVGVFASKTPSPRRCRLYAVATQTARWRERRRAGARSLADRCSAS